MLCVLVSTLLTRLETAVIRRCWPDSFRVLEHHSATLEVNSAVLGATLLAPGSAGTFGGAVLLEPVRRTGLFPGHRSVCGHPHPAGILQLPTDLSGLSHCHDFAGAAGSGLFRVYRDAYLNQTACGTSARTLPRAVCCAETEHGSVPLLRQGRPVPMGKRVDLVYPHEKGPFFFIGTAKKQWKCAADCGILTLIHYHVSTIKESGGAP